MRETPSTQRTEKHAGVDLRCPVMLHDCALAGDDVVVFDFPLTVRPARMLSDKFPVEYEPTHGARIGVVHRETGATTWAAVEPGVVLHAANAHFEGDVLVVRALRTLPSTPSSFIASYTPAFLYEWRIQGERCLSEKYISETACEFPAVDPRCVGADAPCYFAISPRTIGGPNIYGPPSEGILIDRVVKFDLRGGGDDAFADAWTLPENFWLVSEPTVVPKSDGRLGDGVWVLVFGTSTAPARQKTHVYVLDGEDLASGPACVVELPGAGLPYGLHSCWVEGGELAR